MQLVTRPEAFDVLVTENLYGDIVSDLCAGLVGGLGLAPGANIGEHCAVFEAVHGTAPDIAGKGIANPTALLFSALMMLRHLGENELADKIGRSVLRVCADGKCTTVDLGGTASTEEFTAEVIRRAREDA
jgi:isocitrate/isopropylmalate dehydrogenase